MDILLYLLIKDFLSMAHEYHLSASLPLQLVFNYLLDIHDIHYIM